MKKTFYRVTAVLLAFCMLFSAASAAASAAKELEGKTVIIHTNDVHGAIEKYKYVAGIRKDFEEKGAEVILCDAGDFSQGSVNVRAFKGENAVELMNAVGYDVVCPGNHEFDYGIDQLISNLSKASFSVLGANVLRNGETLFEANCVYEGESGLKIGFFGMITPESRTKANPTLIKGLSFPDGKDMITAAKQQVNALSSCDLVIGLWHLGVGASSEPNRSYDLYSAVDGIDMVIDGHSHTVMTEGEKKEPIVSTGTALENVGVIVIDNETKKIEENYLIGIDDTVPADEEVGKLADGMAAQIKEAYGEVIAESTVELNGEKLPGNRTEETNLGDLLSDSMRRAAIDLGGALEVPEENVIAVTNGGGIRAWLHKGDITKNDVLDVLPFFNTLAVVYVTGNQLLEALEASTFCTPEAVGGFPQVSGISFTLNTKEKYAANDETYPDSTYSGPKEIRRVTITDVNGTPFDENAVYAVATNDFCAAGGDTYYAFTDAEKQFDTGIQLDEVLCGYIEKELNGVIGEEYAKPQGRITVKMSFGNKIKSFFLRAWTDIRNFFSGIAAKKKDIFSAKA